MLGSHSRAVLQFSGGKDSTALLYLARPYLDRITVLFGDTGAVFPHVSQFVQETCDRLGVRPQIVRPPMQVEDYTEAYGLPSDIVPVDASLEMQTFIEQAQTLQSYVQCCGAMLWRPMQTAVEENGATLVLRGVKKVDTRKGVPPGHIQDGIEYGAPLWDWSDNDVYAYLKRQGVSLPTHYNAINDSLDCWICTAHLAHHGAGKFRFIRENYPALWPEVRRRSKIVRETVERELSRLAPAVSEVE